MRAFLRAALLAFALFSVAACGSGTVTIDSAAAEALGIDSDMATMDHDMDGDMATMDHDMAGDMAGDAHGHGGIEVPASMDIPQVTIDVSPDPVSGQNLEVTLVDFQVVPQNASTEAIDGQGHLHLYVNGERKMRFYNTSMHLDLPAGEHMLEVEVSANNHSAYEIDGEAIRAMQMIVVPESVGGHMHGGDGMAMTTDVDWAPAPSVSLTVTEDPKSGWNVHAVPENFTLSPEGAGLAPVDAEGHMHLYVNDAKVARLYGEWWHLPTLPSGDVEIRVELNGNDHMALSLDGTTLSASTTVNVPESMDTAAMKQAAMDRSMEGDAVVVSYFGGEVTVAEPRYAVKQGETVSLLFYADDTDELHVHGYDLLLGGTPGKVAELDFVATIPGLFEVELENAGDFVMELQVDS